MDQTVLLQGLMHIHPLFEFCFHSFLNRFITAIVVVLFLLCYIIIIIIAVLAIRKRKKAKQDEAIQMETVQPQQSQQPEQDPYVLTGPQSLSKQNSITVSQTIEKITNVEVKERLGGGAFGMKIFFSSIQF